MTMVSLAILAAVFLLATSNVTAFLAANGVKSLKKGSSDDLLAMERLENHLLNVGRIGKHKVFPNKGKTAKYPRFNAAVKLSQETIKSVTRTINTASFPRDTSSKSNGPETESLMISDSAKTDAPLIIGFRFFLVDPSTFSYAQFVCQVYQYLETQKARLSEILAAASSREIIFCGYGTGGSVAELAAQWLITNAQLAFYENGQGSNKNNQVKVVTWDSVPVYSIEVEQETAIGRRNHLAFVSSLPPANSQFVSVGVIMLTRIKQSKGLSLNSDQLLDSVPQYLNGGTSYREAKHYLGVQLKRLVSFNLQANQVYSSFEIGYSHHYARTCSTALADHLNAELLGERRERAECRLAAQAMPLRTNKFEISCFVDTLYYSTTKEALSNYDTPFKTVSLPLLTFDVTVGRYDEADADLDAEASGESKDDQCLFDLYGKNAKTHWLSPFAESARFLKLAGASRSQHKAMKGCLVRVSDKTDKLWALYNARRGMDLFLLITRSLGHELPQSCEEKIQIQPSMEPLSNAGMQAAISYFKTTQTMDGNRPDNSSHETLTTESLLTSGANGTASSDGCSPGLTAQQLKRLSHIPACLASNDAQFRDCTLPHNLWHRGACPASSTLLNKDSLVRHYKWCKKAGVFVGLAPLYIRNPHREEQMKALSKALAEKKDNTGEPLLYAIHYVRSSTHVVKRLLTGEINGFHAVVIATPEWPELGQDEEEEAMFGKDDGGNGMRTDEDALESEEGGDDTHKTKEQGIPDALSKATTQTDAEPIASKEAAQNIPTVEDSRSTNSGVNGSDVLPELIVN